jgi:uncharacterized protein (UPF0262 family)
MRERALALLDLVEKKGFAYIFHRSQPKAVMLDIAEFVRLQELLEDFFDEQEAKKLAKEPIRKKIPLKTIIHKYV